MDSIVQFDALRYFKDMAEKCKFAKENDFFVCSCPGIDGIGDIIQEYQNHKNFIMVDEISSQNTYSNGSGFFDKNSYTVFIVASHEWDNNEDRYEKLKMCRRIFRQMHSRMIHDKYLRVDESLVFLNEKTIYSREFPSYSLPQMTGLYFMVNNDEPVDLTYDEAEWDD